MSDKDRSILGLMAVADSLVCLFRDVDIEAYTIDTGLDAEVQAVRAALDELQAKVHALYCAENGLVH